MPFESETFYGTIKLGDFTLGKAQMDDLIETQKSYPLEYSKIELVTSNCEEIPPHRFILKKHGFGDFQVIENLELTSRGCKQYSLLARHIRAYVDPLKSILRKSVDPIIEVFESPDKSMTSEEFSGDEDITEQVSFIYSDTTSIKGTLAKAKLGDIRVKYTTKTCKAATILAQQFSNPKTGLTQFRTFNFRNIEALPEDYTKPSIDMLREKERCLDF